MNFVNSFLALFWCANPRLVEPPRDEDLLMSFDRLTILFCIFLCSVFFIWREISGPFVRCTVNFDFYNGSLDTGESADGAEAGAIRSAVHAQGATNGAVDADGELPQASRHWSWTGKRK